MVERVSNLLPQVHVTVICLYSGWMPAFMETSYSCWVRIEALFQKLQRHALDPYLLPTSDDFNAKNRAAHHMRTIGSAQEPVDCSYLSTKTVDKSVDGVPRR